jgi:hypothetical protein
MLPKSLLAPILDNEALTRGLGDAEARMLVEWLVEQAEHRTAGTCDIDVAQREVQRLCRWARGVNRFVQLWCFEESRAAAMQLAASERFDWPLPATYMEPCELMEQILEVGLVRA